MYLYDRFSLYGRNQSNTVKQLSPNLKQVEKKKKKKQKPAFTPALVLEITKEFRPDH